MKFPTISTFRLALGLSAVFIGCGGPTPENPKLDGWYTGRIVYTEPYRAIEIPLFSLEKETLSFGPATESTASPQMTTIAVTWQTEKPYAITLRTAFDFTSERNGEVKNYVGALFGETDGCDRPRGLSIEIAEGVRLSGSLNNGCSFSIWQRLPGN